MLGHAFIVVFFVKLASLHAEQYTSVHISIHRLGRRLGTWLGRLGVELAV